jgi:hypothetical protein
VIGYNAKMAKYLAPAAAVAGALLVVLSFGGKVGADSMLIAGCILLAAALLATRR